MNREELLKRADQRIAEDEKIKIARQNIEYTQGLKEAVADKKSYEIHLLAEADNISLKNRLNNNQYNRVIEILLNVFDLFQMEDAKELEQLLGLVPVAGVDCSSQKSVTVVTNCNGETAIVPDQVPEKPAEKFEVQSITAEDKQEPEDKSLDMYPAKKDKRVKTPPNMTEADIRRMYIDEGKDRKYIANYYGVSEGKINNFLYLHDIKRKKAERHPDKPDKQPEETERP